MFLRVRNPFLTLLLSCRVWVTSKIQVNFRYSRYTRRYWWLCVIDFWNFCTIYVFEVKESIADNPTDYWATMFSTELPCSGDLENPDQLPVQEVYSKVMMNVSNRFLKFLHYLCFRGQGIHCWHFYWATMFGWPQKSRSTSGSRGSQKYWWLCLINLWNFIIIYVFKVKESIVDIPTELPCSGDLGNPDQLPIQ